MTDEDVQILTHLYGVFYGDLHLCGCGNPEDAISLVRDVLRLTPFHADGHFAEVGPLIGGPGANHIVLSTLSHADLIEHGGSIGGSWATDKGNWVRWALERYDDPEDLDERLDMVGFPHDGQDECTPACWRIPAEESNR